MLLGNGGPARRSSLMISRRRGRARIRIRYVQLPRREARIGDKTRSCCRSRAGVAVDRRTGDNNVLCPSRLHRIHPRRVESINWPSVSRAPRCAACSAQISTRFLIDAVRSRWWSWSWYPRRAMPEQRQRAGPRLFTATSRANPNRVGSLIRSTQPPSPVTVFKDTSCCRCLAFAFGLY